MKFFFRIALVGLAVSVFMIGCATQDEQTAVQSHPNFEKMCSKCHTLDRVHVAHKALTQDQMRHIVEKMAEKPDSGINPRDIDTIVKEIY